jgi:spermidine synthase
MMQTGKPAATLPRWLLLTTIFITGNVVMMLEVVGTRVVGPFFGVGLYVWSALITVTLLSLAGGYWVGGKLADRRPDPTWLYAIILGSALLTFLIPLLRNPVLTAAGNMGFKLGTLVGSAVLFGPALFLLGMVTPMATKIYTERLEKIGSRVGLLYSVSTLGSFLGTLTMGFYLIPNFRLSTILVSLGLVLLLLPLVYLLLLRRPAAILLGVLIAVLAAGLLVLSRQPNTERINARVKIVHKSTSLYGELKVLEIEGESRTLLLDGISQSVENTDNSQAIPPYVDDMVSLLNRYQPQAKSVLIIGLGGGSLIHPLLARGVSIDVVEIDRQVIYAAEHYFGIDPKRVSITLEDGRRFVRASRKNYDAIIMNAFVGESTPVHLLTREFFQEAQTRLNPGGILLMNFVSYVQGPNRWGAAAVFATLSDSARWCHVFFRDPKERFSNVLYAAGDAPIPPEPADDPNWTTLRDRELTITGWEQAPVCTDDYNPIDFLNRVVYRRWRQLVIDTYGPEILLN